MTLWCLIFAALATATTLALSVTFGWRVTLQHLDSPDDSTTGKGNPA